MYVYIYIVIYNIQVWVYMNIIYVYVHVPFLSTMTIFSRQRNPGSQRKACVLQGLGFFFHPPGVLDTLW